MTVNYRKKLKRFFLFPAQRLWISFELFNRNGLVNHAAACAYGFLLSAAPVLLSIAFFVSRALAAAPGLVEELHRQIGILFSAFNVHDHVENFLGFSASGLFGLIPVFMILWSARLCAISIQRGFRVIFPGHRSMVGNRLLTVGLGFLTILYVFVILLGLLLVLRLHNFLEYLVHFNRIFFLASLGVLAFVLYRFVPVNPPKIKHIIPAVLVCVCFFLVFSTAFSWLIGPGRYDLLYGTLGRLFLFLVNVYFFFLFFFFGAQLVHVLGASDALLFARFRKHHSKQAPRRLLANKLFAVPSEALEKFIGFYKKGDIVFSRHSQGKEVYYILSGKAGVYMDSECQNRIAVIEETHFFGEMESVLPEGRLASIKAETDLSVMILPSELFNNILQIDPDTDINLIKSLSQRLKTANERMMDQQKN